MLTIIYPGKVNWFFKHQADLLQEDLTRSGLSVRKMMPSEIAASENVVGMALIISYFECAFEAKRTGVEKKFTRAMALFDRRVLLNYDSLMTHYFQNQFSVESAQLTDVVDVCMIRQTSLEQVNGVPYVHIPETFSVAELASAKAWAPGRPVPWAMLGHSNPARIALAAACQQNLSPSGVVFMPPHRPYNKESGLERDGIDRLLQRTDLYVWASHHAAPYHEGLRALHAVAAGAIPCKIDPLHYRRFAGIPWVYRSLDELIQNRDRLGLAELYRRAHARIVANGTIGASLIRVLHLENGNDAPASDLRPRLAPVARLS